MRTLPLVALLFLAAGACIHAPDTRLPVGITHLEAHRADRDLAVQLWYPAAAGADTEKFAVKRIFEGVRVGRGAAYDARGAAKLPLVILSHGNWGTPYSQGWLATQLVDAGYVVLSLQHPGTSAESRTTAGLVRLWDRPADVTKALDALLVDPVWGGRIDRDRIGFLGHSFGAWTAVSLAGGVYSVARQRDACRAMSPPDMYCKSLAQPDTKAVPLDGDGASYADPRIRAFALLAGGVFDGFDAASLESITSPMFVGIAKLDEVLQPASSSRLAAKLPHAQVVTYPTGHFAFIPSCNWLGRRVRGDDLCADFGSPSRGEIHDRVSHDVLAFFATALGGAR
jgi:predicted dienelactone hydrolase